MSAERTLRILHVDNHVLALAKPSGLPCVPDESGDPSLFDLARDWIRREYQKPGKVFLGIVHRLDRPVSGVVVFARTSKAAGRLTKAFKEGQVEKIYWGVTGVEPRGPEGELEQWLRKDRAENRVHVVGPGTPESRRALTTWRKLAQAGRGAGRRVLLELRPRTGRSHQLRVAAASLHAPLLGDLKYGASAALSDKSVALHARFLNLPHPTRGEVLRLECPEPRLDIWRFPPGSLS
jgi:23S rRNA pseudouridine1911/1915/1917 synthase